MSTEHQAGPDTATSTPTSTATTVTTPATATRLDDLLALALSQPRQALAVAREVLASRPAALEAAVAHQATGIVLRDFGDVDESLIELRLARRFAQAAGRPDREADILSTLGSALVMAGQTGRGLTALRTAMRRQPDDGRIVIRMSHVLWLLGRHAEALRAAQQAVLLLRVGGDPVWQARAYSHRAMAALAMGAVERADEDYARGEGLFARSGQHLEYAAARQDRATVAFARGDLPTALTLLDDAQRLVDELGVFEPELVVTRSLVLVAAGLFRDALAVADEGISRSERLRGSATRRGELLFAAAVAAYAAGEISTSIRRSRDALAMFRRQQRPWWAARCELVLLQGRFSAGEESAAMLRRVNGLAQVLERTDPSRAAEAHLLGGQVALRLGRREEANGWLLAAQRSRSADPAVQTVGWLARAVLHEANGRWAPMLTACSRGLELIRRRLGTLGATELRANATAQGTQLSRIALRHTARTANAGQMLLWSERWRAIVLAVPPVRLADDDVMTRDLSALRALARRWDPDAPGPEGARMQQERRRLENAVRQQALHRPGDQGTSAAGLRIAELRDELGDQRLVELTEVDGELFAVVIGPEPARLIHVGAASLARRTLAHALFALRREASGRGHQPLDLAVIGARLQAALLGPAVDRTGTGPVVLVPTGGLHSVPWSLMPELRDRAVTVAPSAGAWLAARRAPPPTDRRVVLVGGPRLSAGAAEISRLTLQYPQAVVLSGGAATADRVLAMMDGAWLVHVAAHGTFRADSPLLSALELDDGPLTAYDLERLTRAPYRVVLSSCNSAVGAPSGSDELLGLVSALISLGCAGVVASVVPVDDPSTVPLMQHLHTRLAGLSLAQALAGARHAVRHDRLASATADSFIALGGR